MIQHFGDLFAYDFTAHMEQRLDQIADGTHPWKEVVRDVWVSYKDRYDALNKKQEVSERSKGFANGVKAVQTKKGPLLLIEGATKDKTQFFGWPSNVSWEEITEEHVLAFMAQQNVAGEWNNVPIERKSGKFGEYFKCGEQSIPYKEESLEETIQRFEAKASGSTKTFKDYVIRTGQYGPYIMKTTKSTQKKPQFVSLPKELDPAVLTEKEVEALYKAGVEQKKTATTTKKLK
jgi:topoisomerase IA-like protein